MMASECLLTRDGLVVLSCMRRVLCRHCSVHTLLCDFALCAFMFMGASLQ